jgi:UDP-N-acetylmuramate dehydrogenase
MIEQIPQYDLFNRNTFRMKVRCALFVEITEEADLEKLDWDALPQPVFVMGGGSNLLFTKDFPGTILHYAVGAASSGTPFASLTPAPPTVRLVRRANGQPAGPSPCPCPGVDMSAEGSTYCHVTVPAGVVFDDFCAWAAAEGLWGPENLSLIPGEVGASAVQNIGAYGVEAKDIITGIRAWDRAERRFVDIHPADCEYGYRTSRFKTEWKGRYIITAVTYRLSREPKPVLDYGGVRKALEARGVAVGSPEDSARFARSGPSHLPDCPPSEQSVTGPLPLPMCGGAHASGEPAAAPLTPQDIRDTIIGIRREKLPDPEEVGSAGSFFCNPVISREHFQRIVAIAQEDNGPEYRVPHFEVGENIKVPAAWMIDQCGFKGVRNGGAQVYPNQPLVIVNATGSATPEEIIGLEQQIIGTLAEKYGITLHPEVEHV